MCDCMSELARAIFVWEYCGGFELNHLNSFFFTLFLFSIRVGGETVKLDGKGVTDS